jgi:tetratricopeptide (TPR) repeat protein
MTRIWVLTSLVSAALVASVVGWDGVRREREFRRLIALGDSSLARDQTSLAIEAFSGAVALKPDSMLGYLKRGDTYRRGGDFAAALRDLRRAATIDPMAPRPKELLGDVNLAMSRFERAADDYSGFVAIDDRSPRVLYKLALARYRNGNASAAVDPLRQAIAIDDRFAEAHHLLGVCLRERRSEADALRSLRRAVSLAPAFSPARAELADLLLALGRTREGIQQLEALAALEPSRAERLVDVGLAYARSGRADTAVLTLGRAAEQYPQEPAVYTALGRVWLEDAVARVDRVALRKAVEALEVVASRDAAPSETLALYGRAIFLSGDVAGAERALTQATSRLPVDPETFLYLAATAELGVVARGDAARTALARYSALAGSHADAAAARMSDVLDLQRQLRFTASGSSRGPARRASHLPGD